MSKMETILCFERSEPFDDYEVYKDISNSLNQYEWFLVKYKWYNNLLVRKEINNEITWYKSSVCEDWAMMAPITIYDSLLTEYNQLIKKETEIKNFIYGMYLLQDILIDDIIKEIKDAFKGTL